MRTTPEIEIAARRHNRVFAAVCGAMLLGTAAFNLAVDPFRVYHDAWARPLAEPDRHLMPGLIRNTRTEYDAITVGTSHSANFRPEVMEPEMGWKMLRCALPGATTPEQLMVLRVALETKRARRVFWGIDHFATLDPPGRAVASGKMPGYLYDRTVRTPLQYLASWSTLRASWPVARGRGHRDVATYGERFESQRHLFGKKHTFDSFPWWVNLMVAEDRKPAPAVQDENVAAIARVIREHPDVEFVCFYPPVSVLASTHEFRNGLFEERLRFREELAAALVDLPNCRLYDFETSDEVTHDFDLYKDPTHHNRDVSDWIIREIAADRHRIRRGDIDRANAEFERQNREFAARLLRPDHPDYERLRIADLPIRAPAVRRPVMATRDRSGLR